MSRLRQLLPVLPILLILFLSPDAPLALGEPAPDAPTAEVGSGFTYQGVLAQGGSPVNGQCDFLFELWDASGGGVQLGGDQILAAVPVVDGLFTVTLNGGGQFGNLPFRGAERWLQIAVRCPAGSGIYEVLTPRQPLAAAPYAHGLRPGVIIEGGVTALTAEGSSAGLIGSGDWTGVRGESASSSGTGVQGVTTAASGATYGVYGLSSSTGGRGVTGRASATSGTTYGVYGLSASSSGRGVYGYASRSSGTTYGVYGESASAAGYGVYGNASSSSSGTTYGVYGRSASGAGRGVYGYATSSSGSTYGVYGRTDSASGQGVVGWATAASGYTTGVRGTSDSPTGRGIHGWATARTGEADGIFGRTDSETGHAVHGWSTATLGDNEGVVAEVKSNAAEALEAWHTGDSDTATIIAGCSLVDCGDMEFRVRRNGNVSADGNYTGGGADYADLLPVAGDLAGYEPGDVLVVGGDGLLRLSSAPYQGTVVGVYSTRPAFVGDPRDEEARRDAVASAAAGEEVARAPAADGLLPVAMAGVVPVKASAENGPIAPGDMLTTASLPGHAMRCAGAEACFGRTMGKALGSLAEGTGVIQMLVVVQ